MKKKNTPNSQSVPMKLYVVVAGLFLSILAGGMPSVS